MARNASLCINIAPIGQVHSMIAFVKYHRMWYLNTMIDVMPKMLAHAKLLSAPKVLRSWIGSTRPQWRARYYHDSWKNEKHSINDINGVGSPLVGHTNYTFGSPKITLGQGKQTECPYLVTTIINGKHNVCTKTNYREIHIEQILNTFEIHAYPACPGLFMFVAFETYILTTASAQYLFVVFDCCSY